MSRMRILVCGASGFVGRHLFAALEAAGHECFRGVRKCVQAGDVAVDYRHDLTVAHWLPKLAGMDVVVNAVGVLRDTASRPMQLLHAVAPSALFQACAEAGVKHIVNISALGVGSGLQTAYFLSKEVAEQALFALPPGPSWLNLRPSLIYGDDGDSAKMFRLLAKLPLHCLPMGGVQRMQPVHIDDLAQAVCRWLDQSVPESASMTVAGPDVVSMREMLDSYREQLGKGKALHLAVPGIFIRAAARVGDFIPFSPLCSETLEMLQAGSTGNNRDFCALLGRPPLSVSCFIAGSGR